MRERAEESERLMDWAFANFEDVTLFTAGDVVERVPVWLGTSPTVPLVGWPRSDGDDAAQLAETCHRSRSAIDTPIQAPVTKGTPLGKLVVSAARRAEHGCAAAGRHRRAEA